MYMGWLTVYLCTLVATTATITSSDRASTTWAVRVTQTSSLLDGWLSKRQDTDTLADKVASELGMINKGRIHPFKDLYKFVQQSANTEGVRIQRSVDSNYDDSIGSHPNVQWLSKQVSLKRTKRAFVPIIRAEREIPDLFFNDPHWPGQWHLHNKQEIGHDVNASGIWARHVTGRGVVVAVVDDGVEFSNTDLMRNYEPRGSYDFNSDDGDPSPHLSEVVDNTHGTRCAGLIAAVANNSVCAVGVAYGARVSGIRMLDGSVTDILEAQSFVYKAHINSVYSCSWGPEDNGQTIEGPGKLAKEALQLGTQYGRHGYGNIYVFASGNGGTMADNCNFDGYANSIYTLTIGAVDELNSMPYYAEPCAAMLAVTYSNGNKRSIVTTDGSTHGGCTSAFSGTSAAAPIAAGMVALMLEVRPCLTWRDVQAIVVYSAVKMDVTGAHWVANDAGFHHSDQHGFGLMDAYRLTVTAAVWALLPVMVVTHVEGGGPWNMPSQGKPLICTLTVTSADVPDGLVTLEYITVTIKVSHVCRGSLEVTLTSPAGTPSTLITPRRYDTSQTGLDWTLTSARFWGEGPIGVWSINIFDHTNMCPRRVREGGALHRWTLTFYGSSLSSEQVASRQKLVEEAVSNGSVQPLFPCPRLNHTYPDLTIPEHGLVALNRWWEVVGLILFSVIVTALCLNFIINCVFRSVKTHCRPRSSSPVLFINKRSGDNEETCALLAEPEDTRLGPGEQRDREERLVFPEEVFVRDNDNHNNNSPQDSTEQDLLNEGLKTMEEVTKSERGCSDRTITQDGSHRCTTKQWLSSDIQRLPEGVTIESTILKHSTELVLNEATSTEEHYSDTLSSALNVGTSQHGYEASVGVTVDANDQYHE